MASFEHRQVLRKILQRSVTLCLLLAVCSCSVGCVEPVESVSETEDPLISVIIPVYNVKSSYLKECLNSVINQTFGEIEIICVDDGSTDGSLKILKKYAKKDKRIIVIHQENRGPSAARNTGIDQALKSNSKYVLFVDSDDILAEDACEILISAAEEDDNIDIVAFNFQTFPAKMCWWEDLRDEIYKNDLDACVSTITDKQRQPLWDKLYKKDTLREVKFIESISYSEDICFSLMVFPRIKWMKCIPNKLYFYRVGNSRSLVGTTKKIKRHNDTLRIMKHVCADWRKLGCLNEHKNALLEALAGEIWKYRYTNKDYTSNFIEAFGEDIFNAKTIKKLPKETQEKLRILYKQWPVSVLSIPSN